MGELHDHGGLERCRHGIRPSTHSGIGVLYILLMAGFKERTLWLLAGPCWVLCGLMVFMDYGDAFMMMSVGLGVFLFIKGAYDVSK